MTRSTLVLGMACGAVIASVVVSRAHAQECSYEPTPGTANAITSAAGQVAASVQQPPADEAASRSLVLQGLAAQWPILVSRVTVEALLAGRVETSLLATASAGGDIARTDKQVGAPASSSGTTTLTENAAQSLLLGLAVEYGALTQQNNGSSVTLGTSPYALIRLGNEDTDDFYQEHRWWRSFALSANFGLDAAEGLNGLKASDVSSLSVKYIYGDRSTRSDVFQDKWRRSGSIQGRLRQIVSQQDRLITEIAPNVESEIDKMAKAAIASDGSDNSLLRLGRWLLRDQSANPEARTEKLAEELTKELCRVIYEPVRRNPPDDLDAEELAALLSSIDQLKREADAETKVIIKEFQENEPLYSLAYSWNNLEGGSDFSELKLIGDGLFGDLGGTGLRLVVNAIVSINHDPDPALRQNRVRDYRAALNLEKTFGNPVSSGFAGNDEFSRMSFSLSAQFKRLEDIDENLGTVQARFALPVAGGFGVPLSLSWSSRTETSSQDEFKVGIGLDFDADTLMALTRLIR